MICNQKIYNCKIIYDKYEHFLDSSNSLKERHVKLHGIV